LVVSIEGFPFSPPLGIKIKIITLTGVFIFKTPELGVIDE
jgi:hypothetical protein